MATNPNANYEMYTRAGDLAVAAIVIRAKLMTLPDFDEVRAPRARVLEAVERLRDDVAKTHPEVYDTAVREALYASIDEVLAEAGYATTKETA